MSAKVGVGTSAHRNPEQAGREAAEAALKQAGVDSCDFVMAFATVGYDQQAVISAVRKATKNAPLTGCSGGGVIAQGVGNEGNHAVAVMVWKSKDLHFRNVIAGGLSTDAAAVGRQVGQQLGEVPSDALGLFVFADFSLNFDAFNRGLGETTKGRRSVPLIGGAAGDNSAGGKAVGREGERLPMKSYQYHDGEVLSDAVSCVLVSGSGGISFDFSHGCEALGSPRIITKADQNWVLEIDGKPALDVLHEYLSADQAKNFNLSMTSMCLGLEAPAEVKEHAGDEYVIRVIAAKDDDRKAFMIFTEVQPGTKMWIMRRNPERMWDGVSRLATRLRSTLKGQTPSAIVQIECLGRGKHMFREDEKMKILEILQKDIGHQIPWIGFYAYGEICPAGATNFLHNYTSVIASIQA